MTPLLTALRKAASQSLKPRPLINLREWADEYRRLSSESAAEPGRWRTSRVPYMAEPMEVVSLDSTKSMVLMISSQLGKTEFELNVAGFYTHLEPSPILIIQPTEGAAASFSKERIAPMIRDTDVLADLFKSDAYGDSVLRLSLNMRQKSQVFLTVLRIWLVLFTIFCLRASLICVGLYTNPTQCQPIYAIAFNSFSAAFNSLAIASPWLRGRSPSQNKFSGLRSQSMLSANALLSSVLNLLIS